MLGFLTTGGHQLEPASNTKWKTYETQINKIVDKSDGKLDTTEIENQLKTIFIKSWMDKGITNTAIEKVKKDIR
jgi:hypothetical protein